MVTEASRFQTAPVDTSLFSQLHQGHFDLLILGDFVPLKESLHFGVESPIESRASSQIPFLDMSHVVQESLGRSPQSPTSAFMAPGIAGEGEGVGVVSVPADFTSSDFSTGTASVVKESIKFFAQPGATSAFDNVG